MTDAHRAELQPVLRRVLFWDTPLENIDVDQHADWLIARVLWRGQLDDVRRVLRVYGVARVAAVAESHRSLPHSFRAFWATVLADEEEPMHPETLAPATQSALAAGGITPVLRRAFSRAPTMNRVHVLRSLSAFDEAEAQPMPEMLAPWS